MTVAVLLLWACIAMETSTRHHAERDARASLDRLRQLRRDPVPVTSPGPWRHSARPTAS